MLPFLQFLIVLAVIITAAKLGGYFSVRLGQPAVAGEVLAGLILVWEFRRTVVVLVILAAGVYVMWQNLAELRN